MRDRFNEQLSALNNELTVLGALCETAIASAAKYLLTGESDMLEAVLEADSRIDQKERHIEALCMKLLLHEQPVAHDFHTVSSALKMISDMERIGDQASDIAEISKYVNKRTLHMKTHISDIASAAIKMVTDSVEAFVKKDITLAKKVIADDDTIDSLFSFIKNDLIQSLKNGHQDAEELLDLLMIAKYFERIGDHAENIAEWVIYSITGIHADV